MLDPAAIGTLLIGLASAGDEARRRQPRHSPAVSRPAGWRVRRPIAGALRRIASVLDGRPVREIAG